MGWQLPQPKRSIEFIQQHQQPDGAFMSQGGDWNPASNLSVLYSTVQAVVALRALGERPKIDPVKVMDRFFVDKVFQKLPWYGTSFFPLFYASLGKPFPEQYDQALRDPERRRLGPRLPQRARRLRPLSRLALRHGRRLFPVRYADPGRASTDREA
jgi:hypothetical protein